MKRILITGASGFLGGHLCRQALAKWEVFGAYHLNQTVPLQVQRVHLDLANGGELMQVLNEAHPEVIVHAAVLQVEACERDPHLAQLVNVEATRAIAAWCGRNSRRLLYISSDLVFDGRRGGYAESDQPQPVLRYGALKRSAELATLEACPDSCVVRLPLMYGHPAAGGGNFFTSMRQSLQRGEKVRVLSDQYRTPGLVDNMAAAVLELAESNFAGLIHVAGLQRCSREEMARSACGWLGYDERLLEPVSMLDLDTTVLRPQDVSLDCSLAQKILKTKLLGYEEGLQKMRP